VRPPADAGDLIVNGYKLDIPKAAKRIWAEDDATPHTEGHVGLYAAWRQLFGKAFDPRKAVATEEQSDGDVIQMPGGIWVWSSYPGASAIYHEADVE
jgi:hypothetical protein